MLHRRSHSIFQFIILIEVGLTVLYYCPYPLVFLSQIVCCLLLHPLVVLSFTLAGVEPIVSSSSLVDLIHPIISSLSVRVRRSGLLVVWILSSSASVVDETYSG